jgi:hypothetical protein
MIMFGITILIRGSKINQRRSKMKKFVNSWVAMVMAVMFLVSCGATQTPEAATETMVVGYESTAMVVFPTVVVYCQTREKNGSLTGEQLVQFKASYKTAADMFVKAGDTAKGYIDGTFPPSALSLLPTVMQQIAIILANLSGGPLQAGQFYKQTKHVPTTAEIRSLTTKMKAGQMLSPVEIEMLVGALIMIAEYIVGKIKGNPTFTDIEKTALKARIDNAQKMIPAWN